MQRKFHYLTNHSASKPSHVVLDFRPIFLIYRSFLIMPIYSRKDDIFALKLNTASPGNTSRGLPVFHSNIWLYDGTTGAPKAAS